MTNDEAPIAHISKDGYLIINDSHYGKDEISLLRKVAEEFKTD